ncbi:hypothetical protein FOZ60_006684 [Perkinsus olseni]|uniref:Uncharacterized protein n=1 Tax=Perkinsus olseni TaxID=32597 RepID=A0A7J6NP94_PEROL|nr:hypothetical protein FOZ60_006684 [Perkinsus olseni]
MARYKPIVSSLLFLGIRLSSSQAAMNLPPDAADNLITKMRTRIFVETKNLVKKDLEEVCSSLAGPSCHFGRPGGSSAKTTGETLVGFDALAAAMPFDVWEFDPSNLPDLLLPPPVENEGKMLDLKEQAVGRRVPSGFSQGLPDGVVASWQGRWLVDDSYRAEKGDDSIIICLGCNG